MSVLKKISKARENIKSSNLGKLGRNEHSKYEYYTPEQVSFLVNEACKELNLLNTYQLKRTELGLVAELTVWDLDKENIYHVFEMATEIPTITATNVAQQLGGAVTYSERYLLMSIYDIKDNNLDFDATKKPSNKTKKEGQTNFTTREIKPSELDGWNGKIYGGNIVYLNKEKVQLSKEQEEKFKTHINYKPDEKK